jgi:uncharacterized UPF0160 family protein
MVNELKSRLKKVESLLSDLDSDLSKAVDNIDESIKMINKIENVSTTSEIIKQINILTTDEVAKIYYAIQESYHFQHLDKFKPI